ncbi:MAG: chromate transporter, partial [Rhizobiales bacterium]|nr:chromate transporter [Hyphomicrobiales bacterium]
MSEKSPARSQTEGKAEPTFNEALRAWASIGVLSFGGPAAQIALMHRVVVDEKKWLEERQFLDALSFCMLLPGPEAMQLATYVGWKLHGTIGGLAAGLLFVLPGALVVLSLAMIYALLGHVPVIEALFVGIKAAVLVIVIDALLRIARRALARSEHWVVAALSLVAIFFLALPYPLIVALAALYGSLRAPAPRGEFHTIKVTAAGSVRTAAVWLSIWLIPLLALTLASGRDGILSGIGWFFSKLAVVTFGGAYAVLAYMAQDVVTNYGWLDAREMMDGLG